MKWGWSGILSSQLFCWSSTSARKHERIYAPALLASLADRTLSHFGGHGKSRLDCINICYEHQYPYAGLQWYEYCFCGTEAEFLLLESKAESECSTPCTRIRSRKFPSRFAEAAGETASTAPATVPVAKPDRSPLHHEKKYSNKHRNQMYIQMIMGINPPGNPRKNK